MVYIPTNTSLGDRVFIGPNAVLTNDRYPPSGIGGLVGPVIERGAAIGANATILPGIHIGEGALVAAAAVVTRDVPAHMLAVGAPGKNTGSAISARSKKSKKCRSPLAGLSQKEHGTNEVPMKILLVSTQDYIHHPVPSRHHYIFEELARRHEVHVAHFHVSRGKRPSHPADR